MDAPHYERLMILGAYANHELTGFFISELRRRGYDAQYPPASAEDGKQALIAFITPSLTEHDLWTMETCTTPEVLQIEPAIVVRYTDDALPLFARDLPTIDARRQPLMDTAAAIDAAVRALPPVRVDESAAPPPSYRGKAPIFLCYASEDRDRVKRLKSELESNGFTTWIDIEGILPGQNWELELRRAIRHSAAAIVCLSQTFVTKFGYVQKELRIVLDVAQEAPEGEIFVIPLRLEQCEVPDSLRPWQWVDGIDAESFSRLVRALDRRLERMR